MQAIITAITGVFTAMATWIADTIPTIVAVFYDSTNGLTFVGVLSVVALGISVFFLLMGLIQNFLHFRG